MNILVCIASYGRSHWNYLDELLAEYRDMDHHVNVVLDLTEERQEGWPDPVVDTNIHPPTIEEELVYEHRKTIANRAGEYDLYIYSEDDVLITEENVEKYLVETERLPENEVTGFLRYEQNQNKPFYYLIDCHPQTRKYHPIDRNPHRRVILDEQVVIQGREYFRLWNLHQGSWILTDDQLSKALNSDGFHRNPGTTKDRPYWWRGHQYYGILESGASDIYTQCGFNHKLLPKDRIDKLLTHHIPNKYVHNEVEWEDPWPLTLSELKSQIGIDG